LPLVLFDHRTYGTFVGRLIAPSFILSAATPVIYASVIGRFGEAGALFLSIGVVAMTFAAALVLKIRFASSSEMTKPDNSAQDRRRQAASNAATTSPPPAAP
jgi:hypothetical protein